MGKCYRALQLKCNAFDALSASVPFGFPDVITISRSEQLWHPSVSEGNFYNTF